MTVLVYQRDGYTSVYDNTDGQGFLKLFREFDEEGFYADIEAGAPQTSFDFTALQGARAGVKESVEILLRLRHHYEYEGWQLVEVE